VRKITASVSSKKNRKALIPHNTEIYHWRCKSRSPSLNTPA
jgi:hypothetical protein